MSNDEIVGRSFYLFSYIQMPKGKNDDGFQSEDDDEIEVNIDERECEMRMLAISNRYKEVQKEDWAIGMVGPAINARIKKLESDYNAFMRVHQRLAVQAEKKDDVQKMEEVEEQISLRYFHTLATLQEEAEKHVRAEISNKSLDLNQTVTSNAGMIRVETARPPEPGEFDGRFVNWPAFRDRFRAEVHNRDFDDVTKLMYLQKACVSHAAETLGVWKPIAANYKRAWESLEEKFEDAYRLQQELISLLIHLPAFEEEAYKPLRKLVNVVNNSLRQLNAMDVSTESWDPIIICLMVAALPKTTKDSWEQKRDVRKMPTLNDLLEFLEAKIRGRSQIEFGNKKNQGQQFFTEANATKNSKKYEQKQNTAHKDKTRKDNDTVQRTLMCYNCEDRHPLFKCKAFLEMTVQEREERASQLKLCKKCLRTHQGTCTGQTCARCPNATHHYLLCRHERTKQPDGTVEKRGANNRADTNPYRKN